MHKNSSVQKRYSYRSRGNTLAIANNRSPRWKVGETIGRAHDSIKYQIKEYLHHDNFTSKFRRHELSSTTFEHQAGKSAERVQNVLRWRETYLE